jgi:hypothetical protein
MVDARNTVSTLQQDDDDDLAKAASTSLWIGSTEVVALSSANFQEPTKKHPGLYSATISDTTMGSMGVPGFPDFPNCWMGVSSSSSAGASRNKASNNIMTTAKDKRAQRKQKRIVRARKAINHVHNRDKNRGQKEQRLVKWRQLLQTRLKKQTVRKDMREIRSKLASLKW